MNIDRDCRRNPESISKGGGTAIITSSLLKGTVVNLTFNLSKWRVALEITFSFMFMFPKYYINKTALYQLTQKICNLR